MVVRFSVIGYPVKHVLSTIYCIGNLRNKEYLDSVYGGLLNNSFTTFACYDSENSLSADHPVAPDTSKEQPVR
jgi:phage major head subunit gpT-like protein